MFDRLFRTDASRPFQAKVEGPPEETAAPAEPEGAAEPASREDGWSVDDIEAAYLRALEAAEIVDAIAEPTESAADDHTPPSATDVLPGQPVESSAQTPPPQAESVALEEQASGPQLTVRQIIEALLFVGGRPLTSKQLANVLGGTCSQDLVDAEIAALNDAYFRQQRSYEVRLGEGGYRIDLKPQFEKVRARVFGVGPREVKLAQNALEVLALVAYQQPVARSDVEEAGIKGVPGLLRQLLRRELIALHRGAEGESDTYRTTKRFLELFGLRSLADLPRPEAVNVR